MIDKLSSEQKQHIRQQLKTRRRALDESSQSIAANNIVTKLRNMPLYQRCRKIALYYAVNGEANPLLLTKAAAKETLFYLPIINKQNTLLFSQFDPDNQYRTNQYGIPEPIYDPQQLISADQLDLICVPLLAFDESRNRLGMGAGYYDRALAFRQTQSKPYFIGLAYEFQKIETIVSEDWDIPMDCIITDEKIYSSPFIEDENLR